MINSLRDFLDGCKKIGELAQVKTEVDWDLELNHVADASDQKGGPALLFENVKGSKDACLIAALSGINRCAIALDMPAGMTGVQMAKEWMTRVKRRIPPVVVPSGPVLENVVKAKDVDLTALPAPKLYPLDGGRYIATTSLLITQDPDEGWTNLGCYRTQILDRNNVAVSILPGKHALQMLNKYRELGKKMPAAICIGQLPVLFFIGSVNIPWGISEYDVAGGLRGGAIEVVKSDMTGLLIPATAEYVLEGEIDPDPATFKPEGPFGEFTGYYSGGGETRPKPNFRVKRILHRNNPIFWTQSVGAIGAGKNVIPSIQISATIWASLENLGVPGIEAVYCPPEAGGRFMTVVSIKQKYHGHAVQVGHAVVATGAGNYRTKFCIVVDDDIHPDNIDEVLWAVAGRADPVRSVQIFKRTFGEMLDPGVPVEDRTATSKAFIDATIPFEWKTKPLMVKADPDTVKKVSARWKEYGIKV